MKLEPLCATGGTAKCAAARGNSMPVPLNIKNRATTESSNPTSGYHSLHLSQSLVITLSVCVYILLILLL